MLAYLYILLMFILLPIRMVWCFIAQVFWKPGFKNSLTSSVVQLSDSEVTTHIEVAESELEVMADDGDGPKFLGLYHLTSRYFPNWVKPMNHMYNFYHEDKTFMRHPVLEDNIGTPTPSGDMLSGLLIARASDNAHNIDTKSKEFVSIIKNIINFKIPFMVPHPNGEMWMRGFIWPLWGDGGDVIETVAMIDAAIETQKHYDDKFDWNLNIMKWLILVTNFPLWIWNYDSAFFMGNKFFVKWFMSHSRMLYFISGYIHTGAWYYKYMAKKIFKRYGKTSPDIAYLYRYFIDPKVNTDNANYLTKSYALEGKGTQKYLDIQEVYIDIEKWIKYPFDREDYHVMRSGYVTPPKYRCETYIFERDPLKVKTCTLGKRQNRIDLIFSLVMAKNFYR